MDRRRQRRWLLSSLFVLTLGLGALLVPSGPEAPASLESEAGQPSPLRTIAAPVSAAVLTDEDEDQEEDEDARPSQELRLWQARLEQSEETLAGYRALTRYPPESRPIREHPDHVYPSMPEQVKPLDEDDPTGVRLRLIQEHVFVAGEQTVDFWIRCEHADGAEARCEVRSARVYPPEVLQRARAFPPVPLVFADRGGPADAVPADGIHSARFQPSREGFSEYEGRLRVEAEVVAGQTQGQAIFDFTYTGPVPAAFTGSVQETLENGSLVLALGVQVHKPGRYVVDARVDDAQGRPFAYLAFNEELRAGRQQVPFTIFGKLIRDEQPAFPLRVRDVDGFLLHEDRDPDRQLMAPLRGHVHTTRVYPATAFAEAEWESEERQRHLDEFSKDVQQAREQVEGLALRR